MKFRILEIRSLVIGVSAWALITAVACPLSSFAQTSEELKVAQDEVRDPSLRQENELEGEHENVPTGRSKESVEPQVSQSGAPVNQPTPQQLYEKGRAHEAGDGVFQNVSLAWAYYLDAAEQGHVLSQYRLAEMSYHGIAVPLNYGRAAEWYERAALAGHPQAQRMLGMMYASGIGVPRDPHRGQVWLAKAEKASAQSASKEETEDAVPNGTHSSETPTLIEYCKFYGIPIVRADQSTYMSDTACKPNLEVVVVDPLTEFGEEVYALWEKVLNPELQFGILSQQKGLEVVFVAEDPIRFSENYGVVSISFPVVTYVVRVNSAEGTLGPWYIEIPAMEYQAVQGGTDQIWFDMNLEQIKAIIRDGGGGNVGMVYSSGVAVSAQWSRPLEMVTGIQMSSSGVGIAGPNGNYVEIDVFTVQQNVTETDDGLWWMNSALEFSDMVVHDKKYGVLSQYKTTVGSLLFGLDLEGSPDQIRKVIMEAVSVSEDATDLPEPDWLRDEDALSIFLSSLMRSFSGRMEIESVKLGEADVISGNTDMIASLDRGIISAGVVGLDSDAANYDFEIGFAGLQYDADPTVAGLVPHSANIGLGFVAIPMRALWKEVVSVLRANADDVGADAGGIEIDGETLLGLLEGSEAHLNILDVSAASESFSIQTSGMLFPKYYGGAQDSVTGNLVVITTGIDELLSHPLVALVSLGYREEIAKVVSLGRPNGPDGSDSLRFNLVLTPEGSVLLNDEDLSGLFVQTLLPETE